MKKSVWGITYWVQLEVPPCPMSECWPYPTESESIHRQTDTQTLCFINIDDTRVIFKLKMWQLLEIINFLHYTVICLTSHEILLKFPTIMNFLKTNVSSDEILIHKKITLPINKALLIRNINYCFTYITKFYVLWYFT